MTTCLTAVAVDLTDRQVEGVRRSMSVRSATDVYFTLLTAAEQMFIADEVGDNFDWQAGTWGTFDPHPDLTAGILRDAPAVLFGERLYLFIRLRGKDDVKRHNIVCPDCGENASEAGVVCLKCRRGITERI